MKAPFGMPGPGGSLGKCAVCGENFLAEIILGQTVPSFELEGVNNQLFAHKRCLPIAKKAKTIEDYPESSPLRAAVLAAKEDA